MALAPSRMRYVWRQTGVVLPAAGRKSAERRVTCALELVGSLESYSGNFLYIGTAFSLPGEAHAGVLASKM